MTIDILEWPENLQGVQSRNFQLVATNIRSRALLTKDVTPAGPTDQRFVTSLSFPARDEEGWREADGLIASLRGSSGKMRLGDPFRCHPYFNHKVMQTTEQWDDSATWDDGTGWASGFLPEFVAVKTAAVRGDRSLVVQGLPASTSPVLYVGDHFEIQPNGIPADHAHLYIVTRRAASDANGDSRVYFEPGLRTGIAPGDKVVLTNPKTVFNLADDEQGAMEVDNQLYGRMGLSLVEVLPRS